MQDNTNNSPAKATFLENFMMRNAIVRPAALCTILILLSGCSTVPRTTPSEFIAGDKMLQNDNFSEEIISISWPALIDPQVKSRFNEATQNFYTEALGSPSDTTHWSGSADASPIASTYFAAEAFTAIKRIFPKAHVILEPSYLTQEKTGKIVLKPISASKIKATINLSILDTQGAKFPFLGAYFTISVRALPIKSAENCGLFVAMQPKLAEVRLRDQNGACIVNGDGMAANPAFYLENYTGTENAIRSLIKNSLPPQSNTIVAFPYTFQSTATVFGASPTEYVTNSRPKDFEAVDTMPLHPYIENVARIIGLVLGEIRAVHDWSRIQEQYVVSFDQNLGNGSNDASVYNSAIKQRNLKLIHRLFDTEMDVREKRDGEIAKSVLGGTYGKNFRTVRDQSYEGFNKMMATSWASAFALAAASGGGIMSPAAQLAQIQTAFEQHIQTLDQFGRAYFLAIAPNLENLEYSAFEFASERTTVDLLDQAKLDAALNKLYRKFKEPRLDVSPSKRISTKRSQ